MPVRLDVVWFPPSCQVITEPHYTEMSSQGVTSSKNVSNNSGLCPTEGQESGLCSQSGPRNQFSSLPLSATRTTPHYQILVIHPAFNLIFNILPRDPQGRPRSYKLLNRAFPCELVGDFISSYPGTKHSPTVCRVEISFKEFRHCRTNVL